MSPIVLAGHMLGGLRQTYSTLPRVSQELKSKQLNLVAAVHQQLQKGGWIKTTNGSPLNQIPGAPGSDGCFQVPGLTITSAHIEQLQKSKEALPHVRHAWLVQEMDKEVLKVGIKIENTWCASC